VEEEEAADHLGVQMVEAVEEAQSLPVQVLQAQSAKAGG